MNQQSSSSSRAAAAAAAAAGALASAPSSSPVSLVAAPRHSASTRPLIYCDIASAITKPLKKVAVPWSSQHEIKVRLGAVCRS
jgi:hypothetical protein